MSQQQLAYEITKLSEASIWELAKEEWKLAYIYEDDGMDSCLCSHPIKEICVLENKHNHTHTKVGNCCVKKFIGLPSDLIFQAVKRVRKDIMKSLNSEALEYVRSKGWINQWEYDFYNSIMSKRVLTEKQKAKKVQVNTMLLRKVQQAPVY